MAQQLTPLAARQLEEQEEEQQEGEETQIGTVGILSGCVTKAAQAVAHVGVSMSLVVTVAGVRLGGCPAKRETFIVEIVQQPGTRLSAALIAASDTMHQQRQRPVSLPPIC